MQQPGGQTLPTPLPVLPPANLTTTPIPTLTPAPSTTPAPPPKPPITPEAALKETYLQLLPHPVLVSLVLALDRNHDAVIWPSDLPSAIDSLREYAKRLYAPSKTPIAPIAAAALPPSVGPHNGPNRTPAPTNGIPAVPPAANRLPTQIIPRLGGPPQPTPVPTYATAYANSATGGVGYGPPGPGRIQPHRNQTGRPPNGPGSGGMPSYEEMIVAALEESREPEGLAPKTIFDYMASHWTLMNNFRPSASQALQKAYKRGRLEKVGGKYRMDPTWEGGNTSKRTTRRPQMGDGENSTAGPAGSGIASTSTQAYPYPWSRPTAIPTNTTSFNSTRYPFTSLTSRPLPGNTSSLLAPRPFTGLPGSSASVNGIGSAPGSFGALRKIKQESGDDEDELQDVDGTSLQLHTHALMASSVDGKPMGVRETLRKLSQLLAESVSYANGSGEPSGAG
ncbi:hypothetical protein DL93DRAFT_1038071 [Clavulina sp. PMI_390]|nr:hypothetical protein DL93DRAFT_1038071 [Clavulina sp. PMI_390]